MKEFKIRASAIGQLMTNPRLKKDKEEGNLSQTAKSYVKKWLKEQLYNRKIEFSNRFVEKGISVEDESIEFLASIRNEFYVKNEQYFENDYITGTPDIILSDKIIDIKNSWGFDTFPLFQKELKNKDYYWQGQGYMALVDRQNYEVCYTLTDTPIELIDKEIFYHCKNNNIERTDAIDQHFYKLMTFKDVDNSLKIKSFPFQRNDEEIEMIYAKVIKAREYIKELLKGIE